MEQGFEKINLEKKTDIHAHDTSTVNNMSRKRRKVRINPKAGIVIFLVVAAIILFGVFGVMLPTQKTVAAAKKTQADAKLAYDALKSQDINAASDQLAVTRADLAQTSNDLHAMAYLQAVPIAAWYYSDANHLLNAGTYGVQGGQLLVDSVKPYADVLGLKGAHKFTGGTAQDRITLAVKTLDKITPQIDQIQTYLVNARKEIDAVDVNHYPSFLGGEKVHTQLAQLRTITDEGATFITSAKPLVKALPSLLGADTDKNYLVIFENDKELRPTGGFMTDYAIFRVSDGVIKVDTSQDIYSLDATIPNHPAAPAPYQKYLKVSTYNLRDTNISPDFTVSMQEFNTLYQQARAYKPVDGIIAVDTHTLVDAMNVLGDMDVDGTTFTTQIVPQCNCAEVIYKLESMVDTPTNHIVTNRKGIIGDLMYTIMQKAFASSPKKYWGPLFQAMIADANQKHILFDLNNSDAQSGMEALNVAGRIKDTTGDYFHLNEANLGGAKSNMFVQEAVKQNYQVKSDGTIVKTITVDYKNPYPGSDCNLEHGNLCLNAVLRNWFRVYVPKGSQLLDSTGSEVKMTSYDELGKTVFDGFNTIRPEGKAQLTISYQLPFKATNDALPFLIQKQPGTDKNDYTIEVNGNKVNEFPLDTDKSLNITLH